MYARRPSDRNSKGLLKYSRATPGGSSTLPARLSEALSETDANRPRVRPTRREGNGSCGAQS